MIGAPPGYVGYDAGGELTNAIREKPFSVVLFDEVEKAHPLILDKFLQVLDDGVLTSGRGERVYFSEALILFTSNFGIYRLNEQRERVLNVAPTDEYPSVQQKVRSEIDRHFKQVINRPELLNRMGENIIVFDFIRDGIAAEIFEAMLAGTLKDAASQDITIQISDNARLELRKLCLADLERRARYPQQGRSAPDQSPGARTVRQRCEARWARRHFRAQVREGHAARAAGGAGVRIAISRVHFPVTTLVPAGGWESGSRAGLSAVPAASPPIHGLRTEAGWS